MALEPFDMKTYLEVIKLLFDNPSQSSKGAVSKSGTQFMPHFPVFPDNDFDEVYPKLFLGNRRIVQEFPRLKSLGITHMVNASMGSKFNQTATSQEFYQDYNIVFHGIPAMDVISFNMLPYLKHVVDFIDNALINGGVVYVHCQQGVSRSATVVLAFLMLKRDMDLVAATRLVRSKRPIHPNEGFVKQLCKLQEEVNASKLNRNDG